MREMKNSGIEWIGEIPKTWSIGKTLYALSMPITDGPHETPQLHDSGIPFVSAEAVSTGYGRINFKHVRGYISKDYYDVCCKKYIPQNNDILMIKSGATTGQIALVKTDVLFTIWSPLAVFRCNTSRMFYLYLYYLLQSCAYQKQIQDKWNYGTQQNIGMRDLEKLYVCFPIIDEQKKIAYYLDSKCSQIDAIISKQEQIIEKLKEYKTSLITEVVTKGLDPNVEMKDSGVEWIGKTPKHWLPIPLKYVVDCNKCVLSEKTRDDFEFDYVDIGSVVYGKGIVLKQHMSFKNSPSRARRIVQSKDVIISTVRTYLKAIAVIPDDIGVMVVSTGFAVLTNKKSILPNFLGFYVQSHPFVSSIESRSLGISYPAINASQLVCINVLLPPLDEQRKIVAHLDAKCSLIDKTISDRQIAIEKLQEYKKSLIYEVVTGKREV